MDEAPSSGLGAPHPPRSGRSNAHAYLEKLQEREYRGRQRDFAESQDVIAIVKERILSANSDLLPQDKLKELEQQLTRDLSLDAITRHGKLPTTFQDQGQWAIVSGLQAQIVDAENHLGMNIDRPVSVGTLPSGEVNAITLAVPASSEILIVFEHGLFHFIFLLSKAVARAFPLGSYDATIDKSEFSASPSEIRDEIASNPEIVQRFQDVLLAYLLEGKPHRATPYILPQTHVGLAGSICTGAELFVMGHEYGHVIAGHVDTQQRIKSTLGGQAVARIPYAWKQELEADTIGLSLAFDAMRSSGFDAASSYWGPDFLVGALDLVEKGISLLGSGSTESGGSQTHPPPETRRAVLRTKFARSFSQDSIEASTIFEMILDDLWDRSAHVISRLHSEGRRPEDSWA